MKLYFICVGPQRSATSWLDRVLRAHPDIALPEVVKETFFLDRRYRKGWEWYWRCFFPQGTHRQRAVTGEVAPTLFHQFAVIDRLKVHNSQCKIVICLRDPLARSLSLFEHLVSTSRVPNDITLASQSVPSIVAGSEYRSAVAAWSSAFGADRVLLLSHRAISERPLDVLRILFKFLGVAPLDNLPEVGREKYGVAAQPRSREIVWLLSRTASALRFLGLHGVANWGKHIGIKRWFYQGGQRPVLNLSDAQRSAFEEHLAPELALVDLVDEHGGITVDRCAGFLRELGGRTQT